MSSEDLRVLYIVDDEQLARSTMQDLTSHGLEVQLVPRADLAIAEVTQIHPDVVLLDLKQPGPDVLDSCRRLRARASVPIIIVTSTEPTGADTGADDYLVRPFAPDELLARVRMHARRGRTERSVKPART